MVFNRFRTVSLGFLVLVLMPACNPTPPELGKPSPQSCPVEEFQRHLWQPKSFLDGLALPKNTRVILPDSAVTLDYAPNRLNIEIGTSGRIERVYCG